MWSETAALVPFNPKDRIFILDLGFFPKKKKSIKFKKKKKS